MRYARRADVRAAPRLLLVARLAASACLAFAGLSSAAQDAPQPKGASPALERIEFSFRVDPRVAKGLYMGDRWISPPTFSISQPLEGAAVDARASGKDRAGKELAIKPRWVPEDPEMVGVTPSEGGDVRIAVRRAGKSRVLVSTDEASSELTIKAVQQGETLSIEIAQPAGAPAAVPETGAEAPRASVLGSATEKESYALGMEFGRRLKRQTTPLDAELVARGLRDALLGGGSLLSEVELQAAMAEVRSRVSGSATRRQSELAEQNLKEGEAFLAENKAKEGVVTLASGLQYRILKAGDGARPSADDTVLCHYRGTLVDGTEFDSSRKRDAPATLPLGRAIEGWREALQLMPVGSKWQLFIPHHLAYGERGARSKVGPNRTLIFEVELLAIEVPPRSAATAAR
jgi:FKBP-type peptidyl-prolyl cis-trans isomerase